MWTIKKIFVICSLILSALSSQSLLASCNNPIIIESGPESCPPGETRELDYCWEEIQTCVKECFYKCVPPPPVCGNGDKEPGEECDDGNNINDDSCTNDCKINPICGNSIVEPGEDCDDGNNINDDACTNQCTFNPACGNGVIEGNEQCDDGNSINYDFCTNACKDNHQNFLPPPPPTALCSEVASPSAVWKLDNNLQDSTGNNNGGFSTSNSFQEGRFGQAHASFGEGFEGVNIDTSATTEVGFGDFSFSIWIKTQDDSFILFKKGADATNGYKIFYEFEHLVIRFENYDDLNTQEYNTFLPNLNDGGWHHIAITVDRSEEDGGRVYYDGYPSSMIPNSWLDAYAFDPTFFPQNLSNSQAYLHIGGSNSGSMTGVQDHVIFFKKALSYAEVRALFTDDCFTEEENMGTGGSACSLNSDYTHSSMQGKPYTEIFLLMAAMYLAFYQIRKRSSKA